MLITVHLLKYTILLILQHIDTAIRHGEIGYIFRWVIRKQKKNPAIHSTKQLLYILLLKNEDKKVIIYIYIHPFPPYPITPFFVLVLNWNSKRATKNGSVNDLGADWPVIRAGCGGVIKLQYGWYSHVDFDFACSLYLSLSYLLFLLTSPSLRPNRTHLMLYFLFLLIFHFYYFRYTYSCSGLFSEWIRHSLILHVMDVIYLYASSALGCTRRPWVEPIVTKRVMCPWMNLSQKTISGAMCTEVIYITLRTWNSCNWLI